MIADCLVVEFAVTGDDCPLSAATREAGVRVDASPPQLRSDDNALLRFSSPVAGDAAVPQSGAEDSDTVDPARYGPLAVALDRDDRIRYLHATRSGDHIDYRCLSKRPCVVHELTDAGFMPESLTYDDGVERHTGAVVGYDVLEGVLSAVAAGDGDGDRAGISVERIHPLSGGEEGSVARRWSITPAQEEALRTALELGYFSVPREADASDVADALGIGKSAALERLRRGHGALLAQLFDVE